MNKARAIDEVLRSIEGVDDKLLNPGGPQAEGASRGPNLRHAD